MSALLPQPTADTHWGSRRLYPKAISVGDAVMVRARTNDYGAEVGWYTDAGTVARGKYGRVYLTVTAVEPDPTDPNWYVLTFADGDPIDGMHQRNNSKLIVRPLKKETP